MKNVIKISSLILGFLLIAIYVEATEVKYNRDAAKYYASRHFGFPDPYSKDNGYNFGQYKCWNGTLKECVNYQDKDGDGKGDGPTVDCANFASQCLIDGGLDFNVYDPKKAHAVTPVVIGKDKKTIGFPVASDVGAALQTSYCFELITDRDKMKSKAKSGDILSFRGRSHVVVYTGNNQYCGHTTDRCGSPYITNPDNLWDNVVLIHFQDDDTNRKCVQFDGSIHAKLVQRSSSSSSLGSGPGGDHPDDNFSVATTTSIDEYDYSNEYSSIGLLNNGFPLDMLKVLSTFNREARLIPIDGLNPSLVGEMPLLIIPSGALAGLSDSQIFKASLEEYVKQGGTILVLSQQHGYEFSAIPGGVSGYGWTEDQSCQANSSSIDTWHQMLAGQTNATPSLNVDGYFTNAPDNAAILLRRTANGQPALITYPYGNGRVIATSAYTDFAFTAGQASSDEMKLIRDIVSWASKPEALPEITLGDTINLNLSISNMDDSNSSTAAWIEIYAPDGKESKAGWKVPLTLAPGQTVQMPISYSSASTDPTGIYHIKYSLYGEKTIYLTSEEEPDGVDTPVEYQLQAFSESDSGRFVVSNPPANPHKNPDFSFSATTTTERVPYGGDAAFTVHLWNNTTANRTLTARYIFPHMYIITKDPIYGVYKNSLDPGTDDQWLTKTVTVPATGYASFDHLVKNVQHDEFLYANFYDENGNFLGTTNRGFFLFYPSVNVYIQTDKGMYKKGETVSTALNIQNKQNDPTDVNLNVKISDSSNTAVYNNTLQVNLTANGAVAQNLNFLLPATAQGGSYIISAEAFGIKNQKVGGNSVYFELPLSQVSAVPIVPAILTTGSNSILFTVGNIGKVGVSRGSLDVTLKDPDGLTVANLSQSFTLNVGENKTIDFPLSIPSLKFGNYTLTYSQIDETRTGKAANITIANAVVIANALDKPSYRIREAATLAVTLTNSGKFNIDNASLTVSVPDAGFTETRTITIGQGQTLPLQYVIPLPETMTAGQHDVNVNISLPSGSSLVQGTKLTIPQSLLTLGTVGTAHPTAGDTITIPVANGGGVDTEVQYKLGLYDAKAALISEKSATETVQAGATLPLTLSIPSGAFDGGYNLVVNYKDTKTIKTEIKTIPVSVAGVKASLTVSTDKQAYLIAESITSLASMTNSGTPLQNGNLHLQVTTAGDSFKTKTWTSQYDFQQGVRNEVDTYGVNDWLIPDDDFEGTLINADKWVTVGNVRLESGKLFIDNTAAESSAEGNWQLEGDFDVEVDFGSNGSVQYQGAEIGVLIGPAWMPIKNTISDGGYFSGIWINGNQIGWNKGGTYVTAGRMRITRQSSTVTTFYWSGSSWVQVYTGTMPEFAGPANVRLWIWGGAGYSGTTATFDNFRVNSGRIVNKNETVDSVRLLPINDNFDDGILNEDRWQRYGYNPLLEESGGLHLMSNTASAVSGVVLRPRLQGDFSAVSKFKNYANSPAEAIQGRYIMLAENETSRFYINRHSDRLSRSGGQFLVGLSSINGIYGVGSEIPYNSDSGSFRLVRQGMTVFDDYWNGTNWVTIHSRSGITTPAFSIYLYTLSQENMPTIQVDIESFYTNAGKYAKQGIITLKHDNGAPVKYGNLSFNSTTPLSTSIKFRTRTADTEAALSSTAWSDITASESVITSPPGRWIEVEATLETTDTNFTPVLHDVSVSYGNNSGDVLWQADVPVNLAQSAISDITKPIGPLWPAGKLYMQGTVTSNTGQTIASSEYSFYVLKGNTALFVNTDKKAYKPGETVTVTGEVRNLTAMTAENLTLDVRRETSDVLHTETFTVPANGSHQFSVTTTAGAEGKVNLAGSVVQNGITLAEISEQYEVASPAAVLTVAAPDMVGKEPFELDVEVKNTGKTAVNGQLSVFSIDGYITINEPIAVPAGETRSFKYLQQITADAVYTFSLTGDVTQTVTKAIVYGEKVQVQFGVNGSELGVKPEGKVAIPVIITNTGLLDENLSTAFSLLPSAISEIRTYFIPKGGSVADTLYYDLTKGSYQLSAVSSLPDATALTLFTVAKENDVVMAVNVGANGNTPVIPVTVNLTNNGWNTIEGSVQLSVVSPSTGSTGSPQAGSGRKVVWSAEQVVSQNTPDSSHLTSFNIDPSGIVPDTYNLEAVLYNNSGQQLVVGNQQLEIKGAIFQITQFPAYTTFAAGSEGSFTFKTRNTGNQEGEVSFNLKTMDVLDQTRTEWLKPGEEKELSFAFMLLEDLEEKDYFAEYKVGAYGNTPLQQGNVKFHVAGVNIGVNATLDKQQYMEGETAQLTLVVYSQQSANLFARVNYAGYESKQSFALNGSQTLTFDIPLAKITGEKLFYGIYHESGRSIHLNSVYVYKAGDVLNIMTDKQVYNPGEMVVVNVGANLGSTLSGEMTLTGPGGYSETFAFSGSATRSIPLPSVMTAGTYQVSGQLPSVSGQLYTASHPIDVNGIQVKVKEATLDKVKYASTDSMKLSLTLVCNKDMSATLRTWVVDPMGTYTPAGEQPISLYYSEPLLVTQNASLLTSSTGIHRLVYGIYADEQPQGSAPTLLLSSGSEAFDVGDAVLMGIVTDKTSYPTNTEPVNVTLTMYGSVAATVELFVDGQSVKTEAVSLNGFMTKAVSAQPSAFTPGLHTIKAVLSSGGLTSVKETGIVYGSNLPDLTVSIGDQPSAISNNNLITLTATVTNQGKTASGATDVAIYAGDSPLAELIATVPLPALNPGESTEVFYDWNVLGKAGVQAISAVVDSGNIINEFNEFNNRSNNSISIPAVVLSLKTAESFYSSGDIVHVDGFATNLSSDITYDPVQVATTVVSLQGAEVFRETASIALPPVSVVSISTSWDTKGMALGDYTITQDIVSGQLVLASDRKAISLNNTIPSCQVLAPLSGQTISGRYPVAWQAQDADGNLLVIDVAYSRDGGSTWIYEAINKANDGTYSWDTTSLPDGSNYKIKIIAKDGTATASCESEIFATLNTGALKINSQPDGAKVYIDGNYAYPGTYYGTTGINIPQIRTGKHTLRLIYPGYLDFSQLLEVFPGVETQVMADLKPFVSVSYSNGVKMMSQGLPIDAGSYSAPVVVDWNMDGKKDLIAGNSNGQVLYYENTGTDNSPLFNSDPVLIITGGQNISPFVVDWENDGRADIIAGEVNGEVLLYKNSSQGSLSFEPGVTIARVSSSAIPFVIDWNEDNKKDLVIGASDGILNIYINQGTDIQPAFNINPDMAVLTSISSISPFVATDWDGNGTKDLIVGSGSGGIYVYPNQGTNTAPSFGAGQSLTGITGPINPGGSSTPFIVDFNNDGLRDLITGNINGEIDLFIASEALVPAVIDLDPDTLSKKSKGQWVTCYIELPDGFSAEDIEITSLLLEGIIPAETKPVAIGDHDSDGIRDLMIKFDRQRLQNLLSKGDKIKVTLTGRLKDGRNIRGEDYIRVTE